MFLCVYRVGGGAESRRPERETESRAARRVRLPCDDWTMDRFFEFVAMSYGTLYICMEYAAVRSTVKYII